MSVNRDKDHRNDVVSKMWEMASMRYRSDRVVVLKTTKAELVPDKKYQWNLYEHESDTVPVDKVILDVNRSESELIQQEVEDDIWNLQRQQSHRK